MSVKETKQDKSIELIINQSGTHKKVAEIPSIGGFIIGSSSTASDNVKIHRSGTTEIQFVPGDDLTSEGISSSNSIRVYFKDMVLGPSAQRYTLGVGADNYFRINPGAADISSNNFVMTNTGEIGIGGIPDTKLTIQLPNPTGIQLFQTLKNSVGNTRFTELYDASNVRKYLGNRSSTPIMTICETNGNVGIGVGLYNPGNAFQVSPLQYSTGTASQSGTTVTGVGTTFTTDMIGSTITFANGLTSGVILGYIDGSTLTVSSSQSISPQAYTINYNTFNINSSGDLILKAKGDGKPFSIWGRNSDDLSWGPLAYDHSGLNIVGGISWSTTGMAIATGTLPTNALSISSTQVVTLANALPVGSGGTGSTSALVQGGVKYALSASAEATTAVGTTGQVLISQGTSAPIWSTVGDSFLATSYIKADGTRALSSSWNAGAFSGTFNSVAVGSTANTISGLSYITGVKNITWTPQTLSPTSGSITWDTDLGSIASLTLTGSATISLSNMKAGSTYVLTLTQGGSGSYTVTWTSILWPAATPPLLSTAVGAKDIITIYYDGTNLIGSYLRGVA